MNQSEAPQEKKDGIKCALCNQEYNGACPTKSSSCPFADSKYDDSMDKDHVFDVPDDFAIDDEFMDEEEDDLLLDPLEDFE